MTNLINCSTSQTFYADSFKSVIVEAKKKLSYVPDLKKFSHVIDYSKGYVNYWYAVDYHTTFCVKKVLVEAGKVNEDGKYIGAKKLLWRLEYRNY